jgi:hypothetical protein
VGSRICDHVPLKHCSFKRIKRGGPQNLICSHAPRLAGRSPRSVVHLFGGYGPRSQVLMPRVASAGLRPRAEMTKTPAILLGRDQGLDHLQGSDPVSRRRPGHYVAPRGGGTGHAYFYSRPLRSHFKKTHFSPQISKQILKKI